MEQSNVIVCGYPKSGNTWATRLIAEAIRCPVRGFWGSSYREIAIEGLDRQSEFSLYKAHQSYQQLSQVGPIHKLVYIVRDPRDVACSGANFFELRKYNEHHGTNLDKYEAMVRTLINGSVYSHCARPWREHVADYTDRNLILLRYEDLQLNALEALAGVMDFIGIKRSREELERAIAAQSFDAVKKRAIAAGDRRNQGFLRKGQLRSYLEELSEEQRARIVSGCAPQMGQLGYID